MKENEDVKKKHLSIESWSQKYKGWKENYIYILR